MKAKQASESDERLTIELTNICNLRCSYCLRDDDALYNSTARFFPLALLDRILHQAREVIGPAHVGFTGGEPTLHPEFANVLEILGSHNLTASFVTNGWHFQKIWPMLVQHRQTISHVGFSLDGATQERHDRWRGEGSFTRLVRAFSRCYAGGLPFVFKVGIRRDTIEQLERIAIFAARMGAAGLNFWHLMPTSEAHEHSLSLSIAERREAEQEIASLATIFKMRIGIDVGYFNIDPAAPCTPLAGTAGNIDYLGRLTLCCNLSGFRGAAEESEVVANLNEESFAVAHARLRRLAESQLEKRRAHLAMLSTEEAEADLYSASPCLFCLKTFSKLPWLGGIRKPARPLPVVN
jgi:sulfatase maturation enzyme AslB (radical SAM superfamily)